MGRYPDAPGGYLAIVIKPGEKKHAGGELIGIVMHPARDVSGSAQTILRWANTHGVGLATRAVDAGRVDGVASLPDDEFASRVDAIVSLGGDGSMLGAMRMVAGRPVPIIGVNHGHLGFLVEVEPGELDTALARLVAGDFSLESHVCLDVSRPNTEDAVAFNDVVVTSAPGTPNLTLALEVNGARYGYYRSDAVIMSTPVGSTAYNYAAGGPVLSPSHPALAVTPVAPMAGISRTVIFGIDDRVCLVPLDAPEEGLVIIDGTQSKGLPATERLTVKLRPDAATIVRLDPDRHAQWGRVKLSLLDLPLLPEQLRELVPSEKLPN